MDEQEKDHRVPGPTGVDADTKEKIEAIARLICAFIAPLTLLIPSRYRKEIQEALERMKEVVGTDAVQTPSLLASDAGTAAETETADALSETAGQEE